MTKVRAGAVRASILVTVCALVAPYAAGAYCRSTTPPTVEDGCMQGLPVAWPITCVGIAVNVHELSVDPARGQDLTDLVRRYVPAAIDAWSNAPCTSATAPSLRMVLADDVDLAAPIALDGHNTVSVNRRWAPDAYHLPGTIAITVVSTDALTGAVLDADIELNARSPDNVLGRTFGDGPVVWGVADAPFVILHEMGHLVGLDHSRDPSAVMAASGGDVERRRRFLTADDIHGVCDAYPARPERPRPAAGCVPERAVAPSVSLAGGGGCSVEISTRASRVDVVLSWIAVALWVRRRRHTSKFALLKTETNT